MLWRPSWRYSFFKFTCKKICTVFIKTLFFVPAFKERFYGLLAEWLGKGLQNLVRRFESARDLQHEESFLPGMALFFQ